MTHTARLSPQDLARSGDLETLEKLWLEEMESLAELPRYLEALRSLSELEQGDRAGVLGGMLLEALDSAGRASDVLQVLEHLASLGVLDVSGVESIVVRALEAAHGSQSWFPLVLAKAHVDLATLDWNGYLRVQSWLAFLPGKVVHHRSGWGTGRVVALHAERDELEIEFASGRRHAVPWQSALETMDSLPAWDIRAMWLQDPAGLTSFAREQPVEVLRRALRIFRGKANAGQLKEFLADKAVRAGSWASWWRKAKDGAVEDPLIAVEGSATRPIFTLRTKALTLGEEARAALRHEDRVEPMLRMLRTYLDRVTRDRDREDLATFARERLGGFLAAGVPDAERLQAVLFLEELGRASEQQAAEVLLPYLGLRVGVTANADFARIARIDDVKLRNRAVSMLPHVLGPGWHRTVASQLARIPEECDETLELLVDLIRKEREPAVLLDVYESIAPFPARHPFLLYLLTKVHAEGSLETADRRLDDSVVCRVILHVLRVTTDGRGQRAVRARLQNRLTTMLLGKKGLLGGLLEKVDRKTMGSLVRIARSAGRDFPPKVQETIDRAAHDRFPELYRIPDKPFWQDESAIYSTRHGLDAQRGRFQHVRDVLIPQNSRAIGAAASLGDLSENAEWEAAIEEQRTLTARATEWEEELRRVRLIEEAELPEGIVVPGTKVRLLDLVTKESKTVRILGPWDSVLGDDVVSYRAPLAAGLLGKGQDDEVRIQLPNGEVTFRILLIEPLF